jgi:hypothetical protein
VSLTSKLPPLPQASWLVLQHFAPQISHCFNDLFPTLKGIIFTSLSKVVIINYILAQNKITNHNA